MMIDIPHVYLAQLLALEQEENSNANIRVTATIYHDINDAPISTTKYDGFRMAVLWPYIYICVIYGEIR